MFFGARCEYVAFFVLVEYSKYLSASGEETFLRISLDKMLYELLNKCRGSTPCADSAKRLK